MITLDLAAAAAFLGIHPDTLAERAGLSDVTWHTLRHTWASWHAMAGTPLDVLQQLGGWASRDMLDRYAHLAPSYVAQFAANARPDGHNVGHRRAKKVA